MRDVEITAATVELYKVLKFEGLAASGGEAKALVADGQVLVNGEVETRKRKQLVAGDVIEVGGEQLRLCAMQSQGAETEGTGEGASGAATKDIGPE